MMTIHVLIIPELLCKLKNVIITLFLVIAFVTNDSYSLSNNDMFHRRSFFTTSITTTTAGILLSTCGSSSSCTAAASDNNPVTSTPPPISMMDDARKIVRPGGIAWYDPVIIGSNNTADTSSWKDDWIQTDLGRSRILASELSPLQQPLSSFGGQELYYAPYLFGAWNVTATLKQKIYPYGLSYVPSISLIEGSPRNRYETVGNVCNYELHYFSTLPNTFANQLVVNLGTGIPKSKIIQDRSYNIVSLSKAYQQLAAPSVDKVIWDYRNEPTKVTVEYSSGAVSDDMRPLGQRRTEIFITARASSSSSTSSSTTTGSSTDNGMTKKQNFASAERYRVVNLSPGSLMVSDTETITEFIPIDDDTIRAICRIVIYLTPNPNSREGILWQQTQGKGIAYFDYDLLLKRNKETFFISNDAATQNQQQRACVKTPNDIVQCE